MQRVRAVNKELGWKNKQLKQQERSFWMLLYVSTPVLFNCNRLSGPFTCRFVRGCVSTKALESEEMCTCLINQFLAARKGPNCGGLPPTYTLFKPPGSKGIRQRAFCKVTDVATGRPVKQKHSTACSAEDPDWHSVWLESKMSPRKHKRTLKTSSKNHKIQKLGFTNLLLKWKEIPLKKD